MATIRSSVQLQDYMTPAIRSITNALNICISAFESMQAVSSNAVNINDFAAARREINNTEIAMNQMQANILNSNDAQNQLNNSMKEGHNHANNLLDTVKGVATGMLAAKLVMGGIQAIGNGFKASDTYVQTQSRLNLMNDGLRTTDQLNDMIFQSAERARSSYTETAKTVAKLGILARNAFSNNDEIVAFAEQMNKQFKIGGSSIEEQAAGMYQLTQSMASGRLQGDEFKSIKETAPLLAQAISQYTGKSMGELNQMSAKGQITADIIKKSMFAAADETNAKFATIPETIGDVGTKISNNAMKIFTPILTRINEIINSNYDSIVNNANVVMGVMSNVMSNMINMGATAGSFFQNNWSIIEPTILGVVSALIVYNSTMGIAWLTTLRSAASMAAKTVADWAETAAIIAMIVAQDGLNAALAACPITWIIMGVVAIIAVFYIAIAAMNRFAGTSWSATGLIVGAFAVAGAFIGNIIESLVNAVMDAIAIIWNIFATVAEFIGTVFTHPIDACVRLFAGLADAVLQILQGIASAIDTVFGSNLASSVGGWRDGLQATVDAKFGEAQIKVQRMDATQYHMQRLDYGQAFDWGYGQGAGAEKWASNLFAAPEMLTVPDQGFNYDDLLNNAKDTADNTGKIKDKMDITDEDLKYLRDIAEQDAINRFTTAEIKVDMVNHNTINNEMDLDGIVDHLGNSLSNSLQTVREGATYGV